MVHMDKKDAVKTALGQARIIDSTFLDCDIVKPVSGDAFAQTFQRATVDVLCKDTPLRANPACETHRVIALARTDIRYRHARRNCRPVHQFGGFAGFIACCLG